MIKLKDLDSNKDNDGYLVIKLKEVVELIQANITILKEKERTLYYDELTQNYNNTIQFLDEFIEGL